MIRIIVFYQGTPDAVMERLCSTISKAIYDHSEAVCRVDVGVLKNYFNMDSDRKRREYGYGRINSSVC